MPLASGRVGPECYGSKSKIFSSMYLRYLVSPPLPLPVPLARSAVCKLHGAVTLSCGPQEHHLLVQNLLGSQKPPPRPLIFIDFYRFSSIFNGLLWLASNFQRFSITFIDFSLPFHPFSLIFLRFSSIFADLPMLFISIHKICSMSIDFHWLHIDFITFSATMYFKTFEINEQSVIVQSCCCSSRADQHWWALVNMDQHWPASFIIDSRCPTLINAYQHQHWTTSVDNDQHWLTPINTDKH